MPLTPLLCDLPYNWNFEIVIIMVCLEQLIFVNPIITIAADVDVVVIAA